MSAQQAKSFKSTQPHFHENEYGTLVKCYHTTKTVLADWKTYVAITISFPIEHFLYEKVWPFTMVTQWLGL